MKATRVVAGGVSLTALVVLAAWGAVTVQAHGGDQPLIHSCIDNAGGGVTVIADNTGYGNPDARCPRPTQQHALDWGATGPPGPAGPQGATGQQGPAGPPGSAAQIQVFENERKGPVQIDPGQAKIVGTLAVVGPGIYQVSAKLRVEARLGLRAYCGLMRGGLPEVDDVARATAGQGADASDPEQTLYLQEVYRLAPRESAVTSFRVRCRNEHPSQPNFFVRDISVHALKIPYAVK